MIRLYCRKKEKNTILCADCEESVSYTHLNPKKGFESYFISFGEGTDLELMSLSLIHISGYSQKYGNQLPVSQTTIGTYSIHPHKLLSVPISYSGLVQIPESVILRKIPVWWFLQDVYKRQHQDTIIKLLTCLMKQKCWNFILFLRQIKFIHPFQKPTSVWI